MLSGLRKTQILEKCRDDRKQKINSRTRWEGYEGVSFVDCHWEYYCHSNGCNYQKEFANVPNYLHFNDEMCNICDAAGISVACLVRKYIAYKRDQEYIYHIGNHLCKAKIFHARQSTFRKIC